MNNQQPNRVEMAVDQWRERENRFNKLFSEGLSTNRSFQREKLHFYEQVSAKFKRSRHMEERFALLVVKQECKVMEKKLYPNLWMRLLRRLLVVPMREMIIIGNDARQIEQNSQLLHQDLHLAGFTGLSTKVDVMMKQGHDQFSIPVSYYVDENKRLDHRLSFDKDQAGRYRFIGFKTSLSNKLKPEDGREQYFSTSELVLDVRNAQNLLEGRAFMKDGTWFQLDFNDKDALGNYRIKEFQSSYGYDLESVIQRFPLKEAMDRSSYDKLLNRLKSGDRRSVTFIKDGKEYRYYIEANPQSKSVAIYDEHSRKITLNTALGNKSMEALTMIHRKGLQQEQADGKRKSNMRIS